MIILVYVVRYKVNCSVGNQTKDLVVLDLAGSSPVSCKTAHNPNHKPEGEGFGFVLSLKNLLT